MKIILEKIAPHLLVIAMEEESVHLIRNAFVMKDFTEIIVRKAYAKIIVT